MQHVEPCETTALCPRVSLPGGLQHCQSVPYKPFPCSLGEQTCKQLHFPSEVVSGDVCWVFFFYLPEVGELDRQDQGVGMIGREGRAAAKHELCLALGGTDCNAGLLVTLSWIIRTKIYCQRRRVEGGQRGLWGQNQSACFPN